MRQGIIAGCDQKQEWLLPWWWKHYSSHNSYPVTFIDFGMSQSAIAWCKERGECLCMPPTPPIVQKKNIPTEQRDLWEAHYGKKIWSARKIWFKKPFALLLSPYSFTIWLDLDCQVNGSLEPLFHLLFLGVEIALKKEPQSIQELHRKKKLILPGETNYNCGLIAFRKEATILHQWTEEIACRNHQYTFDQQALARAASNHRPNLLELPDSYNWSASDGLNPNALVIHYHGGILKQLIRETAALPSSY